jgi:polysaccharide export outer membrane protein
VKNRPGTTNGSALAGVRRACATAALSLSAIGLVGAQSPTLATQANNATAPTAVAVPAGVPTPADYVIGPNDVLTVVFWRDKDISGDVVVRPDGRISVPLINELQASGLTPEQLRQQITTAAAKFVEDPTVSVVVKTINSRRVFITGQVGKPGEYPLSGPTTVLQLLAVAGGVHEFADSKNITIVRSENGRTVAYPFNYKDVLKRKNLKQNIELKPGDTVVVP